MLYRSLLRPILFRLPPETAHEIALHALSFAPGLTRRVFAPQIEQSSILSVERFGLTFPNPIGLAAGFDKDGVALQSLAALGFGFIEAGTVTYHPQPGNRRPRLFRLPKDQALINRAGFNNQGAAAFVQYVAKHRPKCVLGVSIGKSKIVTLENAIEDYLRSFDLVYPVADYIAVNVSSPNTPQLRELQRPDQLAALLEALQKRNVELSVNKAGGESTPLLVKLSPDLNLEELEQIVDVARSKDVNGLIATNTTIGRDGLQTSAERVAACGEGGLSGLPLRERSTNIIAMLYNLTGGSMPLIGVGGVFTAEDAWEKICAGASLIQLYTGFIYQGPGIAKGINEGLERILAREGFQSLEEAVGTRAKEFSTTQLQNRLH
jgi:dihydroorotate dehydrogenase